jgi:ABC-type anion transport system duplicated permease subunit
MPATISGANLAWCDGWFFMIAAEYIQYRGSVVAPPSGGLGYLLALTSYQYEDMNLSIVLLLFITFIVVYFNTLTWHRLMDRISTGVFRPISVRSTLRVELSGVGKLGLMTQANRSHSRRLQWPRPFVIASKSLRRYTRIEKVIVIVLAFSFVLAILFLQAHNLPTLGMILERLNEPPAGELGSLPVLITLTMGRLTIAYGISLIVAIGLGVLAAEHKKMAAVIYPLYDIGQGVPILALFPVIFLGLSQLLGQPRAALELTSIIMLVLDMIWYMFLNIVSAIKNIPSEIREVGQIFGFKGLNRIRHIVIPSILPAIVTGSMLSWGTGWNTVIFAEYMPSTNPAVPPLSVPGIGSLLDKAGYEFGNTIILIFILGIIAAIVLAMEGFVWRPLLRKFEKYHVEV